MDAGTIKPGASALRSRRADGDESIQSFLRLIQGFLGRACVFMLGQSFGLVVTLDWHPKGSNQLEPGPPRVTAGRGSRGQRPPKPSPSKPTGHGPADRFGGSCAD